MMLGALAEQIGMAFLASSESSGTTDLQLSGRGTELKRAALRDWLLGRVAFQEVAASSSGRRSS